MKKILSQLLILTILLGVFSPVFVGAQVVDGGINDPMASNNLNPDADVECSLFHWGQCVMNGISDVVTYLLYNVFLRIASWILYIAGTLLDFVLRYTIIDLKIHLDELTGINITWKVIRDLMNMAFIFILVYKGIELIIGVGSKESIKKFLSTLILAALLVNFSLFFTKILIDASNIVTIGFYKAIMQSANQSIPVTDSTGVTYTPLTGISTPFMTNLGLASFWSKMNFDAVRNATGGNGNMMLIPLLATLLFMITAFVFVSISIIFIIRYITLVILLILSPVAYMGSALPGFGSSSKEWWDTLTGQLTFGPVYMIMTWVVLQLMSTSKFIINSDAFGNLASGGTGQLGAPYEQSSISLIFNFIILIGLIIASLTVAKSTASKGSKFVAKAVGNANGLASTAVFGGSAWLGRKTFGNAGRIIASDADLQAVAAQTGKATGGFANRMAMYGARAVARGTLYASRTARDATYDTRNATIPTSMIGDAIEGTLGRTKYGKMAGLNDMQIGNIPVMAGVSDAMGAGQGGKKSVMDERKESADRVAKRDKDNAKELKLAQAKDKVKKGADDANAQQNDIDEMEKALAKLSEKEIEAMVDGDKKLLDSQNFANSLSIKQLEALNKSELLDSGDKARLKDSRFKDINTAMAALSIPAANRNPQQIAAINSMTKNIRDLHNSELEMLDANYLSDSDFVNNLKPSQIEAINKSSSFSSTQKDAMLGIRFETIDTAMAAGGIVANSPAASAVRSLSDSELEIINANYLNDPTFIAQLKSSQIEAINKSNNFTRNQKDNLRTIRRAPLDAALATNNQQAAIQIVQEMSPEEVAALGPNTINNVNLHSAYTVNMLKRMAVKMSTRDIGSLRSLLTPAGSAARADTRTWLNSQNGLENFS